MEYEIFFEVKKFAYFFNFFRQYNANNTSHLFKLKNV